MRLKIGRPFYRIESAAHWLSPPFFDASRKLVSTFQPWTRRTLYKPCFPIPLKASDGLDLDPEGEAQFQAECKMESLPILKTALLLGAAGFMAFIVFDITTLELSNMEFLLRLLIVLALIALFAQLHHHPEPQAQTSIIAKLATSLAVINLAATLLATGEPGFYTETWVGLLPIYFFCYGQRFMSIASAVTVGWSAMVLLPLSAHLIGADPRQLVSSILILLIVNLFGFCTRRQLENHSRRAFIARRKSEQAAKNKTLFLRQLSHNLRQPLQALSCYASVLETALAEKPAPPLRSMVGKMGTAIDELSNTFNRILDIANLETGQQSPILTTVDINVLMASMEDQFAPLAARRGLKFRVKLRRHPPYNVQTDPCILRQIIGNLLDNAIKYTDQGWVLMEAVSRGNRLELHIRDSGIGIDQEQLPRIFLEFYRGQRRDEDSSAQGMGIGLAYVATAMRHLPNHDLRVYSKPKQGSDFRLSLPVAEAAANYAKTGTADTIDIAGSFVMIVDNEIGILDALAEQVSNWGCLVQKAATLTEVRNLLAENLRLPDLLITDFCLDNGETAHEVMAEVEADCGPTPTLVLSALGIAEEDKSKWPARVHLLRKPANALRLKKTMAQAMGRG